MSRFDAVADLSVVVEDCGLERRRMETSSGFERVTTVVSLAGGGTTGRGEDVTYDAVDHERLADAGGLDVPTGEFTLASFSAALADVALFPEPPERAVSRHYRRWAVESAALDLGLRQAGVSLGEAVGASYDPVRFVVSTRLSGDPPTADRVAAWLDRNDALEFKLDATADWSDDLVATLAATDAVRVVDLKGHYEGTDVDNPPDPALYDRVLEGFPDAYVEDAAVTPETRAALAANRDRLSWDAPVESVADLEALPFPASVVNVKPSRFGTLASLFDALEWCRERDVTLYGGGQFELGPGRAQLQALASLFYADGPNDVAPSGYNAETPADDLPGSPLPAPSGEPGFGR